jgi:hypothetical protein
MIAAPTVIVAPPSSGGLGAPLLALATRVIGEGPPLAAEAASALRAFAATPSPSAYLAAIRWLRALERRHKLDRLGALGGARSSQQGLQRLGQTAGLSPALLQALGALSADSRTGRRLAMLADLVVAHDLLAARTADARQALQQSLGPAPRPPTDRRHAPRAAPRAKRGGGSAKLPPRS